MTIQEQLGVLKETKEVTPFCWMRTDDKWVESFDAMKDRMKNLKPGTLVVLEVRDGGVTYGYPFKKVE